MSDAVSQYQCNLYDFVTALEGFEVVREKTDERNLAGKIVPPIRSEIAGIVFSGIPSQEEISKKLTKKAKQMPEKKTEYKESDYPFLPLLRYFPGDSEQGVRSMSEIKRDVDNGYLSHFEGLEENFWAIKYNIIVSGLPNAGKTHNLGRLAQYFRGIIEEEKKRVNYEQLSEGYIEKKKAEGAKEEELKFLQDLGNCLGLHSERNPLPLKVFAVSTNIPEEKMGENAEPSTDVEQVTVYTNIGILNFLILPGQLKYKRGTSKAFELYTEIETEEGENGEKKAIKVVNIDSFLEESVHNYVMLFANIDRNNLFEGDTGMDFIGHVLYTKYNNGSPTSFTELVEKFDDWRSNYKEARNKEAKQKSPDSKKLVRQIRDMYKEIEANGHDAIALLFREAALWDAYAVTHPNTKVLGVTFTGVDKREEGGRKIMKAFGYDDSSGMDDKVWDNFFGTIADLMSQFAFSAEYFQLQPMGQYGQKSGGPGEFLKSLCKSIRTDIQRKIIDPQIRSANLEVQKLYLLENLGFDLDAESLKQIFDSKKFQLSDSNLVKLMRAPAYTNLDIPVEKLLMLKGKYELPEAYLNKIKDQTEADVKRVFTLAIDSLINSLARGQTVDIEPILKEHKDYEPLLSTDAKNEIQLKIDSLFKFKEAVEKTREQQTHYEFEGMVSDKSATPPSTQLTEEKVNKTPNAPPEEGEIIDFRKRILAPTPSKKGVEAELLTNKLQKTDKPKDPRKALQDELKDLFAKKK